MTDGGSSEDNREEICSNFTVARHFDDPDRVVAIRDVLSMVGQNRISRSDINRHVESPLTAREAASLFTCLQKNDAARQVSSSGVGFADNTFEIRRTIAVRVLTQQAAAIAAGSSRRHNTGDETTATFVATLPGGFDPNSVVVRSIPAIADTIRGQVFNASSSVRIANPYFDPSLELVSDLASLPRRGIDTRILTRETEGSGSDARTALNAMWDQIDPDARERLEVRDLYEWDELRGGQAFATHAKTVIVDDSVCYVGSANLTDTSLSTNFEFGVVVSGELVSDAIAVFDEVFEYSRAVELPI